MMAAGSSLFVATYGHGIYRSDNDGASWRAVNAGLTDTTVESLVWSGGRLFAGTTKDVFMSMDLGASWVPLRLGGIKTWVMSQALSETHLYAGTLGNGVWRFPLSELPTAIHPIGAPGHRRSALRGNRPLIRSGTVWGYAPGLAGESCFRVDGVTIGRPVEYSKRN